MAKISNPQGFGDSRPSASTKDNQASQSGPPEGPMIGGRVSNFGGEMGQRPDCSYGSNHAPVHANISKSEQ